MLNTNSISFTTLFSTVKINNTKVNIKIMIHTSYRLLIIRDNTTSPITLPDSSYFS
jgi:hypothetical protein